MITQGTSAPEVSGAFAAYWADHHSGERAITSLVRLSGGWECDVYAFETDSEAGPHKGVLRIYQGDDPRPKAIREHQALGRLFQLDYPVPRVYALETDPALLGRPFVVMELIEGQPLGFAERTATPAERRELTGEFVGLLVRLHSIPPERFTPEVPAADGYFERWLATTSRLATEIGQRWLDEPLRWLAAQVAGLGPAKLAVTHQDFHQHNVLLRLDGSAIVIDWTQAEVADYRFDLAWTLLLNETFNGRAARDDILSEYERQTARTVDDLGFFEAFAALKRLFGFVVTVRAGPGQVGMRPETAEVMRRLVEHFSRVYDVLRDRSGLSIPVVEALLQDLQHGGTA